MNVLTIGDLCSLTEQEIHHLPIAQPKVVNVRQALQALQSQLHAARSSGKSFHEALGNCPPAVPFVLEFPTCSQVRAYAKNLPF